jgi:hypothetical protein
MRDAKQDLVLVAGSRDTDASTPPRYVLATSADRAKAMEMVSVEYRGRSPPREP